MGLPWVPDSLNRGGNNFFPFWEPTFVAEKFLQNFASCKNIKLLEFTHVLFIVVFYKQIYSLSKNFPEEFSKNCSLTKQIFPIKHNFLSTA